MTASPDTFHSEPLRSSDRSPQELAECAASSDETVTCNTSDAWLAEQLAALTTMIAGSIRTGRAHRWPLARVAAAQVAILAGDQEWRDTAAESP